MPFKDRETENAYRKKVYYERKAKGICPDCGKPKTHGSIYCERHREKYRARSKRNNKAYKERLNKEGRCTKCSRKLLEMDRNNLTCGTCRVKGELYYGSYC
jgi:hypothetical protein